MAMQRTITLVMLGGLGAATASRLARADAPATAALESQAEADFRDGKYADALRGFERVQRLAPRSELLFAIGRCYQELGQCDRAIEVFEDYLASGPAEAARVAAEERIAICRRDLAAPTAVDGLPGDVAPRGHAASGPGRESRADAATGPRRRLPLIIGGAGLVVGAVSVAFEFKGRGALADARAAGVLGDAIALEASYDEANRAHKLAQLGGAIAVATLVTAGIVWWTGGRRGVGQRGAGQRGASQVAAVPVAGGGLVTWSGGF